MLGHHKLISNTTTRSRAPQFLNHLKAACIRRSNAVTCMQMQQLPGNEALSEHTTPHLGAHDLQLALSTAGARGAMLICTQQQPVPSAAAAVKTMVLVHDNADGGCQKLSEVPMSSSQAITVLLLAGHKVDLRAVAEHTRSARGSVRLATADEAVAITGYELGCIPPLGHRQQLRTLVDKHIAQQAPEQLLCAGGGAPDHQLLLPVQQMIQATAAEVGCFSAVKSASGHDGRLPSRSTSQTSRTQLTPAQHQQGSTTFKHMQQPPPMTQPAMFTHLPQPWVEGQEHVELVGVLAQCRRVAKLLLFATFVPEDVPALPPDGTAAYVRRLWRHPSSGMPCEVQLIIGKTIERLLGRDEAALLMDKLKVGSVVSLTGSVQQRTVRLGTSSQNPQSRVHVLDLVVHEIRILHKSRDTLSRALLAARRQGYNVTTAADLEQLTAMQSRTAQPPLASSAEFPAAPFTAASVERGGFSCTARGVPASKLPAAASAGFLQAAVASTEHEEYEISRQQYDPYSQVQPPPKRAKLGGTSEQLYFVSRLQSHQITFVQDLRGLLEMQGTVCKQLSEHAVNMDGANTAVGYTAPSQTHANGNMDSRSRQQPVKFAVGLDCEWQPYARRTPKTPVALLQLATRQHVYIIDLLAICRQQQPPSSTFNSTGYSSIALQEWREGSMATGTGTAVQCFQPLLPAEQALGTFLQQLFLHQHVSIIGFGLAGDLRRLAGSYPWMLSVVADADSAELWNASLSRTPSAAAATACGVPRTASDPAAVCDSASTLIVSSSGTATVAGREAALEPRDEAWVVHQAVDLQVLSQVGASTPLQAHSLSALVERELGRPLDKTQQASDWGKRPLSCEQLRYAANDAHVLTLLYDVLMATRTVG